MSQDENEISRNLINEQISENNPYFSELININFLDLPHNHDNPDNLDDMPIFEKSFSKSQQEYSQDDNKRYFINNIEEPKDQNEEETKEKSDKKQDYKRNQKENTNGRNLRESGINTNLGRKHKDCGKEGNHNKGTTDNMIKKSINFSHKFINKKLNKDLKKILGSCKAFKLKIKKDEVFLKITTEFSKEYSKEKAKNMMKKKYETILIESKIYGNYQRKGENEDKYKDYNKNSINWIYDMKKEIKELERYIKFLQINYGHFWKGLNNYKNNNSNIVSNTKVFNIEQKKYNNLDDNNDYLDEVVQEYINYINEKFNKEEEAEYNNKFKNLQMNMCTLLDYNE